MDDVDKHLQILVRRGKNQVISTIKNETSVKFTELKTIDDVLNFDKISSQILKKIGDVLGRQTRVIHIFAKNMNNPCLVFDLKIVFITPTSHDNSATMLIFSQTFSFGALIITAFFTIPE